ncbi:hypothetical protein J8L98_23470 [Pseudoalteromonas sp. MMG013]|nr:hypothetical protein [Pseudoalteromonas sp. MMG013]MBQ4864648.1 hypothetical protein [Pseudoalteromonas sp. MMG013]
MNLAMKQLAVIGLVTLGYVLGHVSCSPKQAIEPRCLDKSIAPAKPNG